MEGICRRTRQVLTLQRQEEKYTFRDRNVLQSHLLGLPLLSLDISHSWRIVHHILVLHLLVLPIGHVHDVDTALLHRIPTGKVGKGHVLKIG